MKKSDPCWFRALDRWTRSCGNCKNMDEEGNCLLKDQNRADRFLHPSECGDCSYRGCAMNVDGICTNSHHPANVGIESYVLEDL